MDLFEYQGKQYFARFGIPVSAGRRRRHGRRGRGRGRRGRLSGRRQGPGPGRRAGQGGRSQAGRQRRRGPPPCRQHPRPRHQGPRGAAPLGRARLGHRQGVLRQLHPRPGAPRSTSPWCRPRAASRSRRSPKRTPRPSPACTSTRRSGFTEADARPLVDEAGLDPEARDGAVAILHELYRCYVEGDADLVEINPLILTPDGRVHALDAKVTLDDNAAFRHPEWDDFRDIDELDERERLAKSKGLQYVGLDGYVGHHRQRRRARHEHVRRRQPGRRLARQLPRHRRRRQRRGHGQRPRGHQLRPQRAGHLHQHLRRHHPRRGGRQRDRAAPSNGWPSGRPW